MDQYPARGRHAFGPHSSPFRNFGDNNFIYVAPAVGDVLLWESWLRHEVPMNMSEEDRISVSFNYSWG